MEINISEIVNKKLKKLEESKVIEQQIASSVEKTIVQAVKDACEDFRFKKDIKDKIENEVSAVAANIGFTGYNTFIAETFKSLINDVLKKDVQDKMINTFNQMFVNKIDKIKLSEVVERYEELMNNLDEDEKQEAENGHFYVDFDENDSDGSFKHLNIIFALKPQSKGYGYYTSSRSNSSDNKLELRLLSYKDDDYTITSVKYEDHDLSKMDELRYMSDFEALLASLYFNKTKIEVDINEDDVETCLVDY